MCIKLMKVLFPNTPSVKTQLGVVYSQDQHVYEEISSKHSHLYVTYTVANSLLYMRVSERFCVVRKTTYVFTLEETVKIITCKLIKKN